MNPSIGFRFIASSAERELNYSMVTNLPIQRSEPLLSA